MSPVPLVHPLLEGRGVRHGFGVRGWPGPSGLVRPRQVHGIGVVAAREVDASTPVEADAVLSEAGGPPVGVVTADCVPILLGTEGGRHVAAIHAGWRGLAAGVIESAVAGLARRGADTGALVAAIGPHARACCYEVDAPVRAAFAHVPASACGRAFRDRRPGHWMLELSVLTEEALIRAGLSEASIGQIEGACTVCGGERFESYRRDGPSAGRLVHAVIPANEAARGEPGPA